MTVENLMALLRELPPDAEIYRKDTDYQVNYDRDGDFDDVSQNEVTRRVTAADVRTSYLGDAARISQVTLF